MTNRMIEIEKKVDVLLEHKTLEGATNLTVKELKLLNPGFSEKKLYLVINRLSDQFRRKHPKEYEKIIYLFGEKRKVVPRWFYEQEIGMRRD